MAVQEDRIRQGGQAPVRGVRDSSMLLTHTPNLPLHTKALMVLKPGRSKVVTTMPGKLSTLRVAGLKRSNSNSQPFPNEHVQTVGMSRHTVAAAQCVCVCSCCLAAGA
jgi:hypothetical protein